MTRISFLTRIAQAKNTDAAEDIIQEAFLDCSKVLTKAVQSYHPEDRVFLVAAMELTCTALRASMPPLGRETIDDLKKRCAVIQVQV